MTATEPRWRGWGEELPLRWFIRKRCRPDLVVEDLDLVLRSVHRSSLGQFRLVEHKVRKRDMSMGQKMTFGLMDALLRVADPNGRFYEGLFVLTTPVGLPGFDPIDCLDHIDTFIVNGETLTRNQFVRWSEFDDTVFVEPRPPSPTFDRLIASLSKQVA